MAAASTAARDEAQDAPVRPENQYIEKWVGELDTELEQLRPAHEKYVELEAFRRRITGDAESVSPTPAPSRGRRITTNNNSGSRSADGSRKDQLLALVVAQPGITIPAAAAKLNVAANYLYRQRDKLVTEGKVRKEGQQLMPVDALAQRTAELEAARS